MPLYCRASIAHLAGEELVPVETKINDGRRKKSTWQKQGFELRSAPSKVTDWSDAEHVAEHYHPEITEMMLEDTGCDAVLFYPAIVRSSQDETAAANDAGPIEVAHSDYTERYQAMLRTPGHPYISILKPSMSAAKMTSADLANATRVLTLQLWRNIGDPQPDRPLAFCDASTVDRSELSSHFVEEYGGRPAQFESFLLNPPAEGATRRWYTYPELTEDEVVVFRAYDSDRAQDGRPFWTPHCSFADPTVADDAPARSSVEIRAICVFR